MQRDTIGRVVLSVLNESCPVELEIIQGLRDFLSQILSDMLALEDSVDIEWGDKEAKYVIRELNNSYLKGCWGALRIGHSVRRPSL